MRVWISALVLGLWVSYITLICLISLLYSEDHNVKVKVMMKVKTVSRNHSYSHEALCYLLVEHIEWYEGCSPIDVQ